MILSLYTTTNTNCINIATDIFDTYTTAKTTNATPTVATTTLLSCEASG